MELHPACPDHSLQGFPNQPSVWVPLLSAEVLQHLVRPHEGCPRCARTVCKDLSSGLTRRKSDLSHAEVRVLTFIEFSREERVCTSGSAARNLSAAETRSQGFTASLVTPSRAQPQSSCFCCILLHTYTPLSAIKAQAGQELQCSEQMGKSKPGLKPQGLFSWPSSSCWHAKNFKSRIFKTTCVD